MFAAMDDVAGEAAEAEREFAREKEERACCGQDEAEDQEGTTEVAEFHGMSLDLFRLERQEALNGSIEIPGSRGSLGMTILTGSLD